MVVAADIGWIVGTLLTATRLGALLLMSPLFSLARMPVTINALVVLIFAAALNTVVNQYTALDIQTLTALTTALIRELAVGALLAFGINSAFGIFSFSGRLLDLQMGFGVANLLNPSTNEQSPLLGTALLFTAVSTFFLLGGHHWLVRGVVQSFQWFPLAAPLRSISLSAIVSQFGLMFSVGFVLIAPVVAVLLLLDVAMAIAARTMPQMNVFMLSMPVKIVVGCILLAATASSMREIFRRVFLSIFTFWNAVI